MTITIPWLKKKLGDTELKKMLELWGVHKSDWSISVQYKIEGDNIRRIVTDEYNEILGEEILSDIETSNLLWKAYTWWKRKKRKYFKDKERGYEVSFSPDPLYEDVKYFFDNLNK